MSKPPPEGYDRLTEREREILRWIATGYSNQEIADQLYLTLDTVKWYNTQIYQKLGVRSRTQAVAKGREYGLLPQTPEAELDYRLELPRSATVFIGRERELSDIQARLANPRCRLLTLAGPGGIGKTRMALEAAAQFVTRYPEVFPHGAGLVSLQPLTSTDFMVSAIAEAIHFQLVSAESPKQQLLTYLRDKSCLLILDNFEHLLDGVELVSEILAAAPGIKILATSRESLNLQEEWVFAVQGMAYPHGLANVESYESIQLFLHHAHRTRSTFSLTEEAEEVVRICALAEGMPLALELAAAWVRALSCREIADEIKAGLDILETSTRNVLPRHRTMRVVLERSWTSLSDLQRGVFKNLSVFRGGFTREAAQATTEASLHVLSALVDKSWLRWDAARKRYDVHELLRQYGLERLQENPEEWQRAHDAHCHYYARLLERSEALLKGAGEKAIYQEIEQEIENVRASWDWAVSHQEEHEIGIVLESLWFVYDMGSRYREGEQTFARAAAMLHVHPENPSTRLLLGKVLARQGALCFSLDLIPQAAALLSESRDILCAFGVSGDLAFCLWRLGMNRVYEGNLDQALDLLQTSLRLYRQLGDRWGIGSVLLIILEHASRSRGDLPQALGLAQEAVAMFLEAGNQSGLADANLHLAYIFLEMAEYGEARQLAQKSLASFEELGVIWGIAVCYRLGAWANYYLHEYENARMSAHHALRTETKYHLERLSLSTLWMMAHLLMVEKKVERALELVGLVDHAIETMGMKYEFLSIFLSKFEAELEGVQTSAILERGRALDLETTVNAMLEEFDQ